MIERELKFASTRAVHDGIPRPAGRAGKGEITVNSLTTNPRIELNLLHICLYCKSSDVTPFSESETA